MIAAGPLASVVLGGETRFDYGVSAALGFETNPLRVSDDGANGAFTQLALDGSATRIFGPTVALFANGNLQGRFHESAVSDADLGFGGLRAGVGYAPRRFGGGRLALAAGGILSASRSTFIDRQSGSIYEVEGRSGSSPPPLVPIPGRFDANDYGAFLNTRWTQSRTVQWFLDLGWRRSHYINDYSATTELAPLDHRLLSVEPGVNLQLGPILNLGLSVALTDLDYDARPALDEAGNEVAGTKRNYRHATFRSTFSIAPGPRWNLRLGLRVGDRQDLYAGYYDYESRSVFTSVDRELGSRSLLRLVAAWNDLQYDNATVPDATDLFRGTEARTLHLRYEYRIGKQLLWFADVGDRSTDSDDFVFAYDQNWVLSGIQFRR
jgi:hypothetical protein